MSRLSGRSPVLTEAGVVLMLDAFDPFLPPTNEDRRMLYNHIFTVGLPVDRWEHWSAKLKIGKVSEIKTLSDLHALWAWVCAWQIQNEVWTKPISAIGLSVFEQIMCDKIKIELTKPEPALF